MGQRMGKGGRWIKLLYKLEFGKKPHHPISNMRNTQNPTQCWWFWGSDGEAQTQKVGNNRMEGMGGIIRGCEEQCGNSELIQWDPAAHFAGADTAA